MSLSIHSGATMHLGPATDLLNKIIEIGGTTALTSPLSRGALGDWLNANPEKSAWHVAIADDGMLLGFQWIGPYQPGLPPEACDIATFVKAGQTGLGVGSRLFEATKQAALDLGYDWINANIRADNTGGLIYYQSRGFRDWDRIDAAMLSDGTTVSKILKRYDLKD
ncbi:GNAT family N-acetyltransferase [Shimia sediminis]|uniref:GNAT family N-acetyltransferase n=1 Tax=Shimia sediminis TaxID=2497945 RepID=UPI001F347BD0|nr:GNAT family N-acetyltransferase [Shimia sediminis]